MSKIISSKYKLTIAQKRFKMIPRNESEDFRSLPKRTLKMKCKRNMMGVFPATVREASFCCRREHTQRPTARHYADRGRPQVSINPSPQGSGNLTGEKSFIARDVGHQENRALYISVTKQYRYCGSKPRDCKGALNITVAVLCLHGIPECTGKQASGFPCLLSDSFPSVCLALFPCVRFCSISLYLLLSLRSLFVF